MSDFLSKFNKDKYDDLIDEKAKDKGVAGDEAGVAEDKGKLAGAGGKVAEDKAKAAGAGGKVAGDKAKTTGASSKVAGDKGKLAGAGGKVAGAKAKAAEQGKKIPTYSPTRAAKNSYRQDREEEVEIDLDYHKKKRRRMWLMIGTGILALVLIFFIYRMIVHVKVDDFVDEPVSEAREWAKENNVEVKLTQEHSMDHDVNRVISQSVEAGKKIKKGKTLELTSSLGPDPDDELPLPDFAEMSQEEAKEWIEENKAENLQMVTEYSDDIESGSFIKLTINDKDIAEESYRRKDSAAVYYSKGEEVFEKNITMPDFTSAPKEEVEKWVETNEIEMTYKEKDSDTVEAGNIISQSEAADEKIAKRDKMNVVVSTGKAIIVPNFSEYTPDEAAGSHPDLEVRVKQVYHADVAYGKLISQSVEADSKLKEEDDKRITVTYSHGKPYLGDFRGQLEGDLPRLFFDEYQSKGANVKYYVKYVYAPEVKGTVVGMSNFNTFVSMDYTVEIKVSNNASAPPDPSGFPEPDDGGDFEDPSDDLELEE